MDDDRQWAPKTDIGKKVSKGEITDIDEILRMGKPILEPEIVDMLLPNMKREILQIKTTQRMTDCGRKQKFRAVVVVGDGRGHVGIGAGKADEVRPAILSAERDAKKKIMMVPLGCGSWECGCGTEHSVPIAVKGKCGSVQVELKPAPRGLGTAANEIVKKVLELAGVKDVWSASRGHSSTIFNTALATLDALNKLNTMKIAGSWRKADSSVNEMEKAVQVQQEKEEAEQVERKKEEVVQVQQEKEQEGKDAEKEVEEAPETVAETAKEEDGGEGEKKEEKKKRGRKKKEPETEGVGG